MTDDKQPDKKIPFEDLSLEERRRRMLSPMSREEEEQSIEVMKEDAHLLAYNLLREENPDAAEAYLEMLRKEAEELN